MRRRGVLLAALVGLVVCESDDPEEAVSVGACEGDLRIVVVTGHGRCGALEEGGAQGDWEDPVADSGWVDPRDGAFRIELPRGKAVTVMAQCRRPGCHDDPLAPEGNVARWACDDDSDGRLTLELADICRPGGDELCGPGGRAWAGPNGPVCARACDFEDEDGDCIEAATDCDDRDPVGCGDGGGPDAGFDGGSTECACLDPRDSCEIDEGGTFRCVRVELECNAKTACEETHECERSRCWCIDDDACGIACEVDEDCPDRYDMIVCGSGGICRPEQQCLTDAMCEAEELCMKRGLGNHYCDVPGDALVGEPCDDDRDCAQGACEGVCLNRCRSNADCEEGLYCGTTDTDQLGCMVETDCPSCTSPDAACGSYRCEGEACSTTFDCPDGISCELRAPPINFSYCEDEGIFGEACNGDEVSVNDLGEYCCLQRSCWTDSDCGPDHTCEYAFEGSLCCRER